MFTNELFVKASDVAKPRVHMAEPGNWKVTLLGPINGTTAHSCLHIPLLIPLLVTCLEENFLLVLVSTILFHSGMKTCSWIAISPATQLKPFGDLSTQTTLNPGVLVNFPCPSLPAVCVYICSYLLTPRLPCPLDPPTFPYLLFWPKTLAGWVGRGKRSALGKKVSQDRTLFCGR